MNFAPKRAACPGAVDTDDFKGPDGLCVYTAASGLKDEKKYKRRRTLTRHLMTDGILSFTYLNDLRVNFFYNEVYYKSLRVNFILTSFFKLWKKSPSRYYTLQFPRNILLKSLTCEEIKISAHFSNVRFRCIS